MYFESLKTLLHLVQMISHFLDRVKLGNEGGFLLLLRYDKDSNECAFYSRPQSE